MNTTLNYTNESNARRAAKRMIAGGKAPASDFEIKPDALGLFTIHWLSNGAADGETAADEADQPAPSTAAIETEIATASATADQPAPGDADPTPPAATADTDPELAAFETPRLVAELERRGFRHPPGKAGAPDGDGNRAPAQQERRTRRGRGARHRARETRCHLARQPPLPEALQPVGRTRRGWRLGCGPRV